MEVQQPEQLVTKKCLPCEGGVDPCPINVAEEQLTKLNGWYLTHDGQRIRKDWKVKNFMVGMDFFNQVAEIAEDDGHHPDLHIEGYRNVSVPGHQSGCQLFPAPQSSVGIQGPVETFLLDAVLKP